MFQPIEGLETSSVGLSAEIKIDKRSEVPANPFSNSLLVVCEGRAFPVVNREDRRYVLSLLPKKPRREENSYYKKGSQVTPSPLPSCMSTKSDAWSREHKGIKYMAVRKEVTFDDEMHSPRYYSPATSRGEQSGWKSPPPPPSSHDDANRDFDSGEYAYLSGGRGSIMKKFLSDNQESVKIRGESIYSTNPLTEERKLVSSPVPTIDSSSGVSSASSQRSHVGPPSSTPSCSQYSEGCYSSGDSKRNSGGGIIEPTAHYEPVPVRGIARRSSMRVTPCSPIYESKTPVSKEYPMLGRSSSRAQSSVSPNHIHDSGIYGKLRWDNSAPTSSPNYEAIYGKTRRQGQITSPRDHNNMDSNSESKEIIVENLRRPGSETIGNCNSISDSTTSICPPIPPPLPVLSYVTRQNSTVSSSSSPYGTITARNTNSGGILMPVRQIELDSCTTDC